MIRKSKCKAGHFQNKTALQTGSSAPDTQVRLVNPAGFKDVLGLQTDAGTAGTP